MKRKHFFLIILSIIIGIKNVNKLLDGGNIHIFQAKTPFIYLGRDGCYTTLDMPDKFYRDSTYSYLGFNDYWVVTKGVE